MKNLCTLLLLLLSTAIVCGQSIVASGTCGAEGNESSVQWSLTDDGTLSITGTGAMADYPAGGAPWYSYVTEITSVELPAGITSIGSNAFEGCTALTSATVEASTPPAIAETSFVTTDISVSVPFGSLAAYKNADVWKNFRVGTAAESISIQPEYIGQFYDYDGDGQMEYFNIEEEALRNADGSVIRDENYNWYYGAFLKIYSYDGTLEYTSPELSRGISSYDYARDLISIEDMNGDGKPEIVCTNGTNVYIISTDGTLLNSFTTTSGLEYTDGAMIFDANNDGRSDIYMYESGSYNIYYQQPDGSFIKSAIKILDDPSDVENALFAQYGANATVTKPVNFSGVSLARSYGSPFFRMATDAQLFTNAKPMAADINMDGYPDLLNLYNGNALLSIGDGTYYYGSFEGQVTAKDINGDGMTDFILYDEDSKTVTLYIYEGGSSFASKLLMQNMNITDIYTYDIDHDGDIDIVLPFDYTDTSEYAYLVFFENQGNGNFQKRERNFDHGRDIAFIGGGDVDNDGNFEVVAYEREWQGNVFLVDCLPTFNIGAEPETICSIEKSNFGRDEFIFADINNDGVTEWYTSRGEIGQLPTAELNTAPAKASKPTFVFDGAVNMLRVEWEAGTDAENSPCDLTYSLRVGTQPGADDVWAAHADANGRRLRAGKGNVGYDTYALVSTAGWPRGTYYLSVQTIDANGLGGPWSDEAVYEHTGLTANFLVSANQLATSETLIVTTAAPYDDTMTYTWNLGNDAEILKRDGNKWYIAFNRTGNKTISLSVATADGATASSEEVQIAVFPATWDDSVYFGNSTLADLDMDGALERIGGWNGDGIYYFNNGAFEKVARTYNSDLSVRPNAVILDLNMDGLPDMLGNTNKGNWWVNGGSFDFEYSDKEFLASSNLTWAITSNDNRFDFNNDGYLDVIPSCNIGMNRGDNLSFDDVAVCDNNNYCLWQQIDFDRDGYIDLIYCYYAGDIYYLFRNNGDGTFEQIRIATVVNNVYFSDLNNDGYPDMIWSIRPSLNGDVLETGSTHIVLGDETMIYDNKEEIVIEGYAAQFSGGNSSSSSYYNKFVDIDNNGMLDLQVVGADGFSTNSSGNVFLNTAEGVLYLFPGWETVFEKGATYVTASNLFADVNGDGLADYGEEGLMQSRLSNAAPAAPTNVRATQTETGVLLQWDDAVDAETPKAHMLYNVSLKRKGASGENSYIISPLNGGNDVAAATPDYTAYKKSTRMMVPISRFTAGEEYELKVQAIDGWNAHSPFSQAFTFKVESQVLLSAPTEACAGEPVTFTYTGTEQGTPQWAATDGTIISTDGASAQISWTTAGTKTVSLSIGATTTERAIMIEEVADLTVVFPAKVLRGTAVEFTLPEIFATASSATAIYSPLYMGGEVALPIGTYTNDEAAMQSSEAVAIERKGNTLQARVMFNVDGPTELTFAYNGAVCGALTATSKMEVVSVDPQISIVTTNVSGHNVINWDAAAMTSLPVDFTHVVVYKESGSTNNFVQIGESAIATGAFEDITSDASIRKYRYRIALRTADGDVSTMSEVHSSVHVMLNQGVSAGSINIVWTQYEGGIVDSYAIWRGTSADALELLTTANGYETSYTDTQKPEGDVYYAVQYTNLYGTAETTLRNSPEGVGGSSNVVCTSNANTVKFAESIRIMTAESYPSLEPSQQQLHLYAEVSPATATYKRVNWRVTSGSNLATINDEGVLTYIGNGQNGTITVTATTIDGSGISITRNLNAYGFSVLAETLEIDNTYANVLTPNASSVQITAWVLPDDADNPRLAWEVVSGSEYATVSQTGLITATGKGNGTVTVKVSTTDGSELSQYIVVNVKGFVTAIDDVQAPMFCAYGLQGAIRVVGAAAQIEIFDVAGRREYSGTETYIPVPQGIYMVRSAGAVQKVLVR